MCFYAFFGIKSSFLWAEYAQKVQIYVPAENLGTA